jgi:serine/threonine protein kinase
MELLDGETLAAKLRRLGRLPEHEVAAIARQLAAALGAAHAAGVVHRDFKSDNVILCAGPAGEPARAVVTDFGLARSTLVAPGTPTVSTETGVVIGSVAYMAPEQVRANERAGPASDIYALGVVLFETLTGQLPFVGRTPVATALMRLKLDAPPPSAIRPELGTRWDAVVGRCLAREPAARFARVADVAEAIEPRP